MRKPLILALVLAAFSRLGLAEELPPIKPIERVLPPQGVKIDKAERDKLEARLKSIKLRPEAANCTHADLIPDIEIYLKAVRWALDFDEFYDAKKDLAKAHAALDTAEDRLHSLLIEKPDWTTQRGLLVRGYRSNIDDSVQPYGLHIPENLDLTKPVPLLVWLHGRGDKETDLHFIATREKNKGEFAPDWCITLHPFGRGTIGFKFAGEIDVLDAIESVKKRYKIDEDRIALAGFSMGGAGAWHIGAHYADRFCVVHAGAGFVETAKYNRLTPDKYPASYEQKLWGWYDVPCYTRNLFNVPVIAYSGELDKQKQAADLMAEAFKAEGRELRHIIGPGVEHKYEAKAKEQVLKEIKAAVEKGRERWPKKVHLQTRTLRYSKMHWVRVLGVFEHWKDARVDALWDDSRITITTSNVESIDLTSLAEKIDGPVRLVIDNDPISLSRADVEKAGLVLWRYDKKWQTSEWSVGLTDYTGKIALVEFDPSLTPRKSHAFGSIDDAFMSPFLVVLPTGPSPNPKVQRWVDFESKRFFARWRELFRGDARVKAARDISESDQERFNIILWGDFHSNTLMRSLVKEKMLRRMRNNIVVEGREFAENLHIPVLIYPQAFDVGHNAWTLSDRYIVLNSGPTFREGHDRTNSQQTPKLPDWAIIGLDKDPDAFAPGTIKAAGFFDESWKVKKAE